VNTLCRLLGHRWRPSHRLDKSTYGLPIWVYTDHVCIRCYKTEWKMPYPKGQGR
jgi:hypothetical protein